ncbi:hypothetical protein A9Q96_06330 [Rhodobacterales bacterium 52_120_T64]|nr:hypothetical protein A9Q96_06330 [Rhodobacterales bacterium 52_120_T64]
MRIFKFLTKGAALVALSVLVACTGVQDTATGPTPIPKAVRVTAGDVAVVIAAPDGFCIDRATIAESTKGAFMFLSDCRVVASTGKASRVPISSILTASISPTGLAGSENGMKPALGALGQFLATPVGVFSLSKSQVNGATSILQTKQTDTALYLLVEDNAFSDEAGVSNRYWRAFTEVNGRLVALSVTGYSDSDPEEKRSLRIIRSFMQAIVDANTATS